MKIYFAHPVSVYDTPLEGAMLKLITESFLGVEIVNPNTPEYQKMYQELKDATGGTHGNHKAMDVFYELLKHLDGCVSLPFLDCRMGLGVAGETQKTVKLGKPAWLIAPSRVLTAEELDEFVACPLNGFFSIRPLTEEESRLLASHPGDLKDNPPDFVVGHEETRLRTFYVYGREKRPYAEAHLAKMPVPEGFYPDKK